MAVNNEEDLARRALAERIAAMNVSQLAAPVQPVALPKDTGALQQGPLVAGVYRRGTPGAAAVNRDAFAPIILGSGEIIQSDDQRYQKELESLTAEQLRAAQKAASEQLAKYPASSTAESIALRDKDIRETQARHQREYETWKLNRIAQKEAELRDAVNRVAEPGTADKAIRTKYDKDAQSAYDSLYDLDPRSASKIAPWLRRTSEAKATTLERSIASDPKLAQADLEARARQNIKEGEAPLDTLKRWVTEYGPTAARVVAHAVLGLPFTVVDQTMQQIAGTPVEPVTAEVAIGDGQQQQQQQGVPQQGSMALGVSSERASRGGVNLGYVDPVTGEAYRGARSAEIEAAVAQGNWNALTLEEQAKYFESRRAELDEAQNAEVAAQRQAVMARRAYNDNIAEAEMARDEIDPTINPSRYYDNQNTGQKLLGILAAGLFGFAGKSNEFFSMMEREVARDIDAQRATFDAKMLKAQKGVEAAKSAYERIINVTNDDILTAALVKKGMYDELERKLKSINLERAPNNVRLQAQALAARLGAEGEKIATEIDQNAKAFEARQRAEIAQLSARYIRERDAAKLRLAAAGRGKPLSDGMQTKRVNHLKMYKTVSDALTWLRGRMDIATRMGDTLRPEFFQDPVTRDKLKDLRLIQSSAFVDLLGTLQKADLDLIEPFITGVGIRDTPRSIESLSKIGDQIAASYNNYGFGEIEKDLVTSGIGGFTREQEIRDGIEQRELE